LVEPISLERQEVHGEIPRTQIKELGPLPLVPRASRVTPELIHLGGVFDPAIGIADVRLGELQEYDLIFWDDAKHPFELDDAAGCRLSGELVIPVLLEGRRCAFDDPGGRFGRNSCDVASAAKEDGGGDEEPSTRAM